jgi:general stress protein YciG/biotin operon repressor
MQPEPCVWAGCPRPRWRKHRMCHLHESRKRRGQDMNAPPRFKTWRLGIKQHSYEETRAGLLALLREGPRSVSELSRQLGVSRAALMTWIPRLENEGHFIECAWKRRARGGMRVRHFYIFTGTDFSASPEYLQPTEEDDMDEFLEEEAEVLRREERMVGETHPPKPSMTVSEAGRLGGQKVSAERGPEFYRTIGKKGGHALKAKCGPEHYRAIGKKGGDKVAAAIGLEGYRSLGKKGGTTTAARGSDYFRQIGAKGVQRLRELIAEARAARKAGGNE